MKLTGERPMQGATPDSLLAFHDAGYREVVARLGSGVVVDLGCGVGDETARLTGPDRFVVGVDYSADTMCEAAADHAKNARVRLSWRSKRPRTFRATGCSRRSAERKPIRSGLSGSGTPRSIAGAA